MAFSQATITGIDQPSYQGALMFLSWTTTSPSDTWFQVYLDNALAWWGQTTNTRLPIPTVSPVRVDVGTVDPGEEQTDFSADLPAAAAKFAELNWVGGLWEGLDLAGFYVYGSDAPVTVSDAGFGDYGYGDGMYGLGGPATINFTTPLANITAYPGGLTMDGFGLGGFGLGGFGLSSGAYQWISGPLQSGVWEFAVVPYDAAGNLGTPAFTSCTICVPPLPPALFDDGARLHYVYYDGFGESVFGGGAFGGEFTTTLTWNASPG